MKELDYPCVKINGVYHVTISAKQCLCGKTYCYGGVNMHSKIIITNNILWKEIDEITCPVCRQRLT